MNCLFNVICSCDMRTYRRYIRETFETKFVYIPNNSIEWGYLIFSTDYNLMTTSWILSTHVQTISYTHVEIIKYISCAPTEYIIIPLNKG